MAVPCGYIAGKGADSGHGTGLGMNVGVCLAVLHAAGDGAVNSRNRQGGVKCREDIVFLVGIAKYCCQDGRGDIIVL